MPTPEQHRKSMQGNKSSGTKIEIVLGKALYAAGLRYRKNNKAILGSPDFSFAKHKVAVFADGDFWHGKNWDERRKKKIGNDPAYWYAKIERNIERDYNVTKQLCEDGWTVLRFWETDIKKNLQQCVVAVTEAIAKAKAKTEEQKRLRKIYRKKIVVPGECDKDIIDDYISAAMPHIKAQRKKKAVKKTRDLLQYKYPNENITLKVAEDILKYAAPKKNKH